MRDVSAATQQGTGDEEEKLNPLRHVMQTFCFEHSLISYLTNRFLVLTEEGLQFQTFGGGQSSDLSVGSDRHQRRLGQQTVEQTQEGE